MTERIDLYIGVVVILMFLAGCFLLVVSARDRTEQRSRWRMDDDKDRRARGK